MGRFDNWVTNLANEAFFGINKSAHMQYLSTPINRSINLNPEGDVLGWMDAVDLYESDYQFLRLKYGWRIVVGYGFNRKDTPSRFAPVRWSVGEVIVEASYDSYAGIVFEKVIKK